MAGNTRPFLRPELIATGREITAVIAIFVGPLAYRSAYAALHGSSTKFIPVLLSNSHLLQTCAAEAAMLAAFFLFLARRGWNPPDFTIRFNWLGSLQGISLVVLSATANALTVLGLTLFFFALQTRDHTLLSYLSANGPHLHAHTIALSWTVILCTMIMNAFFEEIIFTAYIFNQLAERTRPALALGLTVLLRMSCHTYQGFAHVLGIGACFLTFGVVYWFTRNLWPLIFAHAIIDTFSTAVVKILYGR